jgi:hypothetical protein
MICGRRELAGTGVQNSALAFGGDFAYSLKSSTEDYNGHLWSGGGNLITGRSRLAGAGTQNAGLAFGGYYNYNPVNCTEEYAGSSYYGIDAFYTNENQILMTGSLDITGSVTIRDMLTITSQSVLPTIGVPSGSIMTSGSGADFKPYFWNGSTWTALF